MGSLHQQSMLSLNAAALNIHWLGTAEWINMTQPNFPESVNVSVLLQELVFLL